MYKLIAIDIDGTLLQSNKTVSERTVKAIEQANAKGVQIVLTTGRPTIGAQVFLQQLGLCEETDYVIGYNGALVEKVTPRETISYTTITGSDYKKIYKLGVELGFEPYAFDRDTCISTAHYRCVDEEIKANLVNFEMVDNIENFPDVRPLAKVMLSGTPAFLDENVSKIPLHLYEEYTAMRSCADLFEILKSGVNKGTGVAFLANRLGIKKEEIICIGDSWNDLHMIEYAGLGIAMGNGTQAAKDIADYITLTNDEHGVAHAIEKFILNV